MVRVNEEWNGVWQTDDVEALKFVLANVPAAKTAKSLKSSIKPLTLLLDEFNPRERQH